MYFAIKLYYINKKLLNKKKLVMQGIYLSFN